jgi:dTDP-4-amino-4,6-dideoxygalactose transaminase
MTAGRVASLDLLAEFMEVREGVEAAVRRVLESGRYIGGPEVEGLEREFAAYCGTAHGVGVNSGTDALRFALIAAGVGPGHEVITTPFTFIGSTEAISQAGAVTVFADIEPATFTLDPARVQAALTPRTRALMPVHLYGQPADMEGLRSIARSRGLAIIEDACQAHGAALGGHRTGALGTAGCFSFYPTKNLGAAGEGGLVTTDDAVLADRVRRLRDHGQSQKYVHAEEGYNGRLDAIQAAILRVKLNRLEGWNERRRQIASRYRAGLAEAEKQGLVTLPAERAGARHVYHLFAVRVPGSGANSRRDRVRGALQDAGIETGVHYPIPLHRQPCYAAMGKGEGSFPESERASREVLTLPLYPQLRDAQVDLVAETLSRTLATR